MARTCLGHSSNVSTNGASTPDGTGPGQTSWPLHTAGTGGGIYVVDADPANDVEEATNISTLGSIGQAAGNVTWRAVGWDSLTQSHFVILMLLTEQPGFTQYGGTNAIIMLRSHPDPSTTNQIGLTLWQKSSGGHYVWDLRRRDSAGTWIAFATWDTASSTTLTSGGAVMLAVEVDTSGTHQARFLTCPFPYDGSTNVWTQRIAMTSVGVSTTNATPFSPPGGAVSAKASATGAKFGTLSGWGNTTGFLFGVGAEATTDADLGKMEQVCLVPGADVAGGEWNQSGGAVTRDRYTAVDDFEDANDCGNDYIFNNGGISADSDQWFEITSPSWSSPTIEGVVILLNCALRVFATPDFRAPSQLLLRDSSGGFVHVYDIEPYGSNHMRYGHYSATFGTTMYLFLRQHPGTASASPTAWTSTLVDQLEIGVRKDLNDGGATEEDQDAYSICVVPLGYGFTRAAQANLPCPKERRGVALMSANAGVF